MAEDLEVLGGKWTLGAELGAGAMAVVRRATHRNGAVAAVKILHKILATDRDLCERFLAEGYLTNSVKHPGIVRVFDDGHTESGQPYLVMDLLEGETLEAFRVRKNGTLELAQALKRADQIADILGTVHSAGLIHRDLKTTNIFLTEDGGLKILDFGMARSLLSRNVAKGSLVNTVVGTPSFMSPEQARGKRQLVDGQSDQWGFAAVLFLLLTGQPVHVAGSVEQRLRAAASEPARPIRSVAPELDADVAAVIDRALSFHKADRWTSVQEMRAALAVAGARVIASAAELVRTEAPAFYAEHTLPLAASAAGAPEPHLAIASANVPRDMMPTFAPMRARKEQETLPAAHESPKGILIARVAEPDTTFLTPPSRQPIGIDGTLPLSNRGGAARLTRLDGADEAAPLVELVAEIPPPPPVQAEVVGQPPGAFGFAFDESPRDDVVQSATSSLLRDLARERYEANDSLRPSLKTMPSPPPDRDVPAPPVDPLTPEEPSSLPPPEAVNKTPFAIEPTMMTRPRYSGAAVASVTGVFGAAIVALSVAATLLVGYGRLTRNRTGATALSTEADLPLVVPSAVVSAELATPALGAADASVLHATDAGSAPGPLR